jgi:hypothetical protein
MARRRRPPRSGALTELPPLKILGQIAALQGVYYATALVLVLFSSLVSGTRFGPDLIFGWSSVRGDTTQGWVMAFLWILDGGLVVYVPPNPVRCKHLFLEIMLVLTCWVELGLSLSCSSSRDPS